MELKGIYPNDFNSRVPNMTTVVDLREQLDEFNSANGIEDKQIQLAIINLGLRSNK
jgi:hypothetical protein